MLSKNEKVKSEESVSEKQTAATIPQSIEIPVKFNKKIQKLTIDEASELAQKGMKFEAISEDYELLKQLAGKSGKSVSQYLQWLKADGLEKRKAELLEKCGGDDALAEHILGLEEADGADTKNFKEVNQKFPEIKSIEQLPLEVIENAELSGRGLLDEYLRYLLDEKIGLLAAEKQQKLAESRSSGSLTSRAGVINPETAEFLKGLWK